MNVLTKSLSAALLTTIGATSAAVAQDTLVSYATFPGAGDRVSISGDTTVAGVTGVDMTRGGGLATGTANNAFTSTGWATNIDGTPTVLNEAGYVEIGLSLAAGLSATLDELIIGTRSSTSGPSQIGVFASTDGYTTAIATIDENSNFSNSVISLASVGAITGEFKLRFMNTGGVTPADPSVPGEEDMDLDSTWRIASFFNAGDFTDPQITGTVVPEPASLALLGLGGLALTARRRTRGQ